MDPKKAKSFRAAGRGRDRIARIIRDFHFGRPDARLIHPALCRVKQIVSWVSSSSSGVLEIAGALAWGIIGIYSVVSYTVSQRRGEIGIRLALGAQGRDVLQMVLRQSAKMALEGAAIPIAADS
jgi:hypothetical protein